MKTLSLRLLQSPLAQAAILLACGLCARGQSWETLLSLNDANGYAVIIDPALDDPMPDGPGLFVGGQSNLGAVLHLDPSTDPDTVTPSNPTPFQTRRLGSDTWGGLYAVGHVRMGAESSWQARKSEDGGAIWSIVDDASAWIPNKNSTALGIAADASGNVYVSGQAYLSKTGKFPSWVIRRGVNHGQNWTTVYTSPKEIAIGSAIQFLPPIPAKHDGGIFAVGRLTPGGVTQWTVLRSRNAGLTWDTVDAWTPAKNTAAAATGLSTDSEGNLFVIGFDGGGAPGWYVRKSTDGGQSWQTILTKYSEGALATTMPNDVAADGDGNVFVVGVTSGGINRTTWTIRQWDAALQQWDAWPASLRFPVAPGVSYSVAARGVAVDATGSVYVTGQMDTRWVVQRLSAN